MGVYKKGKNWYIDYYLQGQRKRKKIGPSKQPAELALKDVELKIAKGEYLGIYEEKQILFEAFAQDYLAHCRTNHSPRSYDRDELTFRVHLTPFFKGQYLYNITAQSIEKYKNERLKDVNPATISRELTALKTHLVMSGCDIRTVQKLLGHKTIEMTMRYSHLSKDHLKNAVKNLNFCEPIDTIWTPAENQQKAVASIH